VPRGFGFVHHSIAILYHEVPNPHLTIRNFLIAVGGGEPSTARAKLRPASARPRPRADALAPPLPPPLLRPTSAPPRPTHAAPRVVGSLVQEALEAAVGRDGDHGDDDDATSQYPASDFPTDSEWTDQQCVSLCSAELN
jgi:hypothetical protein